MTLLIVLLFFIFLLLGIPIALVLAITTLVYLVVSGNFILLLSAPQRMFSGLDNFGLLAIPLFMLAGELMNGGGITKRLIDFAKSLLGHVRGGLAYVVVIANTFLASILGSANAQSAMMSRVMVPEMEKEGYRRDISSALTLSSSILAPVIPPSMLFIIYGTLTGASIGGLFVAGIIPGILLSFGFIALVMILGYKYNFPKGQPLEIAVVGHTFVRVIPALLIPFIIIWGILSGAFTPTESAAIACLIAFIVGFFFYRELSMDKLPAILLNTVMNTATVTFLIATANMFGWLITFEQIPQTIANAMLNFSEEPWVFLLLLNILLLIIGTVLDGIAALIILIPVLMPLLVIYGVDPIHLGVIICINLTIGLMTPPVGTGLFIVSSIAKVKLETLIRAMIPFLLMAVFILLIITYWEKSVMFLPDLLRK